jgi:cytoskeleton protein RodZ
MGQALHKDQTPTPPPPELSAGEILARTRLHYGLSFDDVEQALRIRAEMIEAIETGRMDRLPGPVYALGFVRTYSEYLGLDTEKIVQLFRCQMSQRKASPDLHFPVAVSENRMPPLWLVVLSLLVGFLAVGAWWSMQAGGEAERASVESIPSVPEEIIAESEHDSMAALSAQGVTGVDRGAQISTEEEASQAEMLEDSESETTELGTAAQEAETVSAEVAAPRGIILNILQNSWVEIRDNSGKAVLSRVLKAGDQYFVPDRPDLTMALGNAGGVAIEVDGEALSFLGKEGQVRRNIPLDAQKLKSLYAMEQRPDEILENRLENISGQENTLDRVVE